MEQLSYQTNDTPVQSGYLLYGRQRGSRGKQNLPAHIYVYHSNEKLFHPGLSMLYQERHVVYCLPH